VKQPVLTAPATRGVHDLSAELTVLIGRLTRTVTRAAGLDVPTASLRLLSQVDELGPVTIGALADADRCSQPTMSSAVQTLCRRGWASKTPNPEDGRSSLVALTGAGRQVLGDARRKRADVVVGLFAADHEHDERDLATAVAVFRGLLAARTGQDVDARPAGRQPADQPLDQPVDQPEGDA
jgi:DNA-binding MarR family transcriptional regulator